jgi:pseudouridine 5'-phosphatase
LRILEWANIPLSLEQWKEKEAAQIRLFSKTKLLPGVMDLLQNLSRSTSPRIRVALASSAGRKLFNIKTDHIPELRHHFVSECCVFGDDPSMASCNKKPAPDIFLLAKDLLNQAFIADEEPAVTPEECLVFEDSIAGVEAGRRAGMQVVWVPHPGLAKVCRGREQEVLTGRTEDRGTPEFTDRGEEHEELPHGSLLSQDGKARMLQSLEDFPYAAYGIKV